MYLVRFLHKTTHTTTKNGYVYQVNMHQVRNIYSVYIYIYVTDYLYGRS